MIDWDTLPNFTRSEFECRCGCGAADMDPHFMDCLQALRADVGLPFVISSGYRCINHDRAVGGSGAHTSGKAVDIQCFGSLASEVVNMAPRHGFPRIGVSQKGAQQRRFIHLDQWDGGPSPWIWSY